jgi:hypothetical protein
VVHR